MDLAGYDLLATGVLLVSRQGTVQYANMTSEELFGLSRKQLVGLFGYSLFSIDSALEARFLDAVNGQFGVMRQDLSINRPGAASVPVNLTIVPLDSQPWAAVLEVRVIEHHVLLDRNQRLARELEVQRESLRNLAHEIKNPLGGIRGAAQLLHAELDAGSSVEVNALCEYTRVIIAEADRLSSLVDRLIAPQGQALQKTLFNIHEICERVFTLACAEFGPDVHFVRDYDISTPDLYGDAARLLQALLNIVRNAAQALNEGSIPRPPAKVVLRTRIGHRLALSTQPVKMGIVVSVIDNGPGVADEMRDKIFHPLVTGRAHGTGLGLSLAQEYLQQHGGVVEFDSRPGHTEFRMILPLEAA